MTGSPNYPALTRTYVGGTTTLTFSDMASLSGNLYDLHPADSITTSYSALRKATRSAFSAEVMPMAKRAS